MLFSAGDKVKFLNSTGGGVITRILDHRTVMVLTSDGFELPTLTSELIKMDRVEPAARLFNDQTDFPEVFPLTAPAEQEDNRSVSLSGDVIRRREQEEIYLAFLPHDQKWLVTGQVDILLINSSGYHVLYNIFRKTHTGHYEGIDYGSALPDTSLLLDTVNHEQLGHWAEGYIQFLFHKDQIPVVIPPFNAEFRIEGKKFYREGSYRESGFFKGKGLLVRILALPELTVSARKDENTILPALLQDSEETSPVILQHQVAPREAEVDLHIHELMEDPGNLENREILEFQLRYFNQCLESARIHRFLKVTFIHGVGNGILRQHLIARLEKEEGITFYDAPLSKYGSGALEVRLPHNF